MFNYWSMSPVVGWALDLHLLTLCLACSNAMIAYDLSGKVGVGLRDKYTEEKKTTKKQETNNYKHTNNIYPTF